MKGLAKVKEDSKVRYAGLTLKIIGLYSYNKEEVPGAYPKGTRHFRLSLDGTEWEYQQEYTVMAETELEIVELLEDKPANSHQIYWRSVKEGYPEPCADDNPVLAYIPADPIVKSKARTYLVGFSSKDAGIWPYVTFWMPAPAGPVLEGRERVKNSIS